MPWLCVGDFNEICHEKLGGRLRPLRQMKEFRDVLDECGFRDLGFASTLGAMVMRRGTRFGNGWIESLPLQIGLKNF